MQTIFLVLCAYLCGSIPTGKLVGLYKNIDIQKHGSGNIGFANAVRVLGWRPGLIVLAGDVAKGFMPMLLAQYLGVEGAALLLVGLAPIVGHSHPLWLGFRGGKSIATGLGVLAVISPALAVCGVAVYCVVLAVCRQSAVGSLVGVWTLPIFAAIIEPTLVMYMMLLATYATYTHRQNIRSYVRAYAD